MDYTFASFIDGSYDYDPSKKTHTGIHIYNKNADIGGGKITIADIDVLSDYPNIDTVSISGLNQQTFEYFICKFGKKLRAIKFFKNKAVEDLSLLGTLPQLEYVHFFHNQRVTELWDMSNNISLTGLCIEDFSRLHSIQGVETAQSLKEFSIGDALWSTTIIESLNPLKNTMIEKLSFTGKAISDNDLSFLSHMPRLKEFNFATNLFTTEQVAWIVSNFPLLSGFALKARHDCMLCDRKLYDKSRIIKDVPSTIIVGKRKPALNIAGNEAKIVKYEAKFEELKKQYEGKNYIDVFTVNHS